MQTLFLLGTPIDWRAILLMAERLSTCLTVVDLRTSNFRNFGVKIHRKESSCSISPLGKANTMWIRLPRIPSEDCAKKRGAESIHVLRQSATLTIRALKLWSWTRSAPHSFARPLRSTRKMEVVLKTSQTFWRNPVSILGTASDSTETELLLSFPIRSTTAIFAMVAKSTRVSTSQSSQRKFLTRRRKVLKREA